MKKLISLALIFSILFSNFSVLAVEDNSIAYQEQPESTVKKDLGSKPVLGRLGNKLKKVLIVGGALAVFALACYGAYKIGNENCGSVAKVGKYRLPISSMFALGYYGLLVTFLLNTHKDVQSGGHGAGMVWLFVAPLASVCGVIGIILTAILPRWYDFR